MTFSDFVNETRINQARILLTEGKTVSEAALKAASIIWGILRRFLKNMNRLIRKILEKK